MQANFPQNTPCLLIPWGVMEDTAQMLGLIKSLFSVRSPFYILYYTARHGERIGEDPLGNVYYRGKPRPGYGRERRWVRYNLPMGEIPDASLVPAEWHAWLLHQQGEFPDLGATRLRKPWQKPHLPNMTGTDQAYLPPGHLLREGRRPRATGDYEAWTPPE